MKILNLTIKGFLSLKEVTWQLGDLNVVVGANASGKSNLLEALILLREMIDGKLSDRLQALGGIDWVTWNQEARPITLNGKFEAPELKTEVNSNPGIRYFMELHPQGGKFGQNRYGVERENLNKILIIPEWLDLETDIGGLPENGMIDRTEPQAFIRDDSLQVKEVSLDSRDPEESLYASKPRPAFSQTADNFADFIRVWQVFKSFRSDTESEIRKPQVSRVKLSMFDESELANLLHTRYSNFGDFKDQIDNAMSAVFPDYESLIFGPSSQQKIELSIKWKNLKSIYPAVSLSDGTLRFLFVIAALLASDPGNLIAIDEPETGLHPRMFDVLAGVAKDVSRRTQVIFTTHSAEFLNAMSRFAPTTTIARLEDGETKLETVDKETLDYWLKEDFLGDMHVSGALEAIA